MQLLEINRGDDNDGRKVLVELRSLRALENKIHIS
jgi:hypothetical protein